MMAQKLPSSVYLAGACTLFVAALSSAFLAQPAPPAVLSVDNPIVHAGTLGQGDVAKASFLLTNHCPKVVFIRRVENSCTCTTTMLTKTKLRPHESVLLHASFNLGNSRGPVQTKCAVLYFQEDSNRLQSLELRIAATCEPDIRIKPTELTFHAEEPSVQEVRLSAGRKELFELLSVYCDRAGFSADILPQADASVERRVRVVFDPAKWSGIRGTAHLTLTTDSLAEPNARVTLMVVRPVEPAEMTVN